MIISPRLPDGKALFGKLRWNSLVGQYLMMLMLGTLQRRGRMSAQQVASVIASDSRHRASVGRFLKLHGGRVRWTRHRVSRRLLKVSLGRGRYVFIVDTTFVGHQGEHTENTFSTGNRKRRPVKGRRYSKYQRARRSCHAFVCGLLITPQGVRIPYVRYYYTPEYCQQHHLPHRTQADLAAELIGEVTVPQGAEVIVLGDTGFEAKQVRAACQQRGFFWIMPANPERVLGGAKPRPKLWSLTKRFRPSQFAPVRLQPNQGPLTAMRRLSPARRGSKNQPRTFYVHEERRVVHSIGETRIVFSTKQKPACGKRLQRETTKILLTNAQHLDVAQIVELYLIRWQIELFFKELKSSLGMHQYRFRNFRCVEGWMEAFFITFVYLEWIRIRRMRSAKTGRQRQAWSGQRTHGLAQAVCQRLAEDQIHTLHRYSTTDWGIRKLRKLLRNALPTENRNVA